jgi:hypothetical protein
MEMILMSPIDALRHSVQRVGDPQLQEELLGRIGELQRSFAEQMLEIETMRTRLAGAGFGTESVPGFVYDPPV